MKIWILEKSRGPSGDSLHKGLEYERGTWCRSLVPAGRLRRWGVLEQNPRQEDKSPRLPERDGLETEDLRHQPVPQEVGWDGADDAHERDDHDRENTDTDPECQLFQPVHDLPPQGTVFSTALLPQRLSVPRGSDNVTNIAYIRLKVKRNKKTLKYGLFLGFRIGLKNFLFPECKTANSFLSPKCNTFWPPSEARRLSQTCNFLNGAQGGIRTPEARRRLIYSQVRLTTPPPTQ